MLTNGIETSEGKQRPFKVKIKITEIGINIEIVPNSTGFTLRKARWAGVLLSEVLSFVNSCLYDSAHRDDGIAFYNLQTAIENFMAFYLSKGEARERLGNSTYFGDFKSLTNFVSYWETSLDDSFRFTKVSPYIFTTKVFPDQTILISSHVLGGATYKIVEGFSQTPHDKERVWEDIDTIPRKVFRVLGEEIIFSDQLPSADILDSAIPVSITEFVQIVNNGEVDTRPFKIIPFK